MPYAVYKVDYSLNLFTAFSLCYRLTIYNYRNQDHPKRTGSDQFKRKGPRRARTFFSPQLSKFLRFGRPEQENWAALIHEQGHSGQNQFWELVRSI